MKAAAAATQRSDENLHPSTHPIVRRFWRHLCSRDSARARRAVEGLKVAVETGSGEIGAESSVGEERPSKKGLPGVTGLPARLFELESLALSYTRLPRILVVLGGIRILNALVQIAEGGSTHVQRRQRLASELRILLDTVPLRVGAEDGWKVLEAAADATGALVEVCASHGDVAIVESFIAPALASRGGGGMNSSTAMTPEFEQYAAILVVSRLASAGLSAIFEKRWPLLEVIWSLIGGPCQKVREACAEALGGLLKLVHSRENSDRTYRLALREAESGFGSESPECIHGALLIVRQLLENPGPWMLGAKESWSLGAIESHDMFNPWWHVGPGQVLDEKGGGELSYVEGKFCAFCPIVLSHRDSSAPYIRRAVMEVLPIIARFSPESQPNFLAGTDKSSLQSSVESSSHGGNFIETATRFLLMAARQGSAEERKVAFASLAKLGSSIGPILQARTSLWSAIARTIREGIQKGINEGILHCVVMTVRTTSSKLELESPPHGEVQRIGRELADLIRDLVSSQPLTYGLVATLMATVTAMPSLRENVREGLLRQITRILRESTHIMEDGLDRWNHEGLPSGTPPEGGLAWIDKVTTESWSDSVISTDRVICFNLDTVSEIEVALEVLGNYDFYSEHFDELGISCHEHLSYGSISSPPRSLTPRSRMNAAAASVEEKKGIATLEERLSVPPALRRAFALLKSFGLKFLNSPNSSIRLSAASASCNLLSRVMTLFGPSPQICATSSEMRNGNGSANSLWGIPRCNSSGDGGFTRGDSWWHCRNSNSFSKSVEMMSPGGVEMGSSSELKWPEAFPTNASSPIKSPSGTAFATECWDLLDCSSVLTRLVAAGLSDESSQVRASVFDRLFRAPELDPFVSRLPCNWLEYASQDRTIGVRRRALSIAARAAAVAQPTSLGPFLTRVLVTLTRHQQVTKDVLLRRDQIVLVTDIIISSGEIVRPYIPAVLPPLIHELRQNSALSPWSPLVATAALNAVGCISEVSPHEVSPVLDSVIFPAIVNSLHSTESLHRRVVAMEALSRIVRSTGCVILPYFRHAGLLHAIIEALMSSDSAQVRLRSAALCAYGLLGALDPLEFRQVGKQTGPSIGGPSAYSRLSGKGLQRQQGQIESRNSLKREVDVNSMTSPGTRNSIELSRNFGQKVICTRTTNQLALESLPGNESESLSSFWYSNMTGPGVVSKVSLDVMEINKVILTLLDVLENSSLSLHHQAVVSTLVEITDKLVHDASTLPHDIFETHLSRILKELILLIRKEMAASGVTHFSRFLFEQLTALVTLGGDILGPSELCIISALLQDFWTTNWHLDLDLGSVSCVSLCLCVIDALRNSTGSDRFRLLVPDLVPLLLDAIRPAKLFPRQEEQGVKRITCEVSVSVMRSLGRMRGCLHDYLPLVITELLRLVEFHENPVLHRRIALLSALQLLSAPETDLLAGQLGALVKTLLEITSQSQNSSSSHDTCAEADEMSQLQQLAVTSLNWVACRMKRDYIPFVNSAWTRLAAVAGTLQYEAYRNTVDRLLRGCQLPPEPNLPEIDSELPPLPLPPAQMRHHSTMLEVDSTELRHPMEPIIDQRALIAAFDTSSCAKQRDWKVWLRKVCIELLRQSPSPLLRLCAPLAANHHPVAQRLLRPSFLSMWVWMESNITGSPWDADSGAHISSLSDIVMSVEAALRSPVLPSSILSQLLNLVEFMELQDKPLPLEPSLLAKRAENANALAKLLYYREQQFLGMMAGGSNRSGAPFPPETAQVPCTRPGPSCIESLINVNHRLGLSEAASGILQHAQRLFGPSLLVQPEWLEQVGMQVEALELYQKLADISGEVGTSEGGQQLSFIRRTRRQSEDGASSTTLGDDNVLSANERYWGNTTNEGSDYFYFEYKLGQLRCLDYLGQYEEVAASSMDLYYKLCNIVLTIDTFGEGDGVEPEEKMRAGSIASLGDLSPSNRMIKGKKDHTSMADLRTPAGNHSRSQGMVRSQTNVSLSSLGTNGSSAAGNVLALADVDLRRNVNSRRDTFKAPLTRQQRLAQWESWLVQSSTLSARACLALRRWDELGSCVRSEYSRRKELPRHQHLSDGGVDESNFMLLLAIVEAQRDHTQSARFWIEHARQQLAPCVSASLNESYSRAYSSLVMLQQLAEVEEVVDFKESHFSDPEREEKLSSLRQKWDTRLSWMPEDTTMWRRVLSIRSLLLEREQCFETWLRLGSLARKEGNFTLCANTLKSIGANIPSESPSISFESLSFKSGPSHPATLFETCMCMWAAGMKDSALKSIDRLREKLLEVHIRETTHQPCGNSFVSCSGRFHGVCGSSTESVSEIDPFKQLCSTMVVPVILVYSSWRIIYSEEMGSSAEEMRTRQVAALSDLHRATEIEPDNYEAWHALGVMNFRLKENPAISASQVRLNSPNPYVTAAIRCFFRGISLGRNQPTVSILQDTLRLLTLWFEHGSDPAVDSEFDSGMRVTPAETWLSVIPQIIARVHTRSSLIKNTLKTLLIGIGRDHPQALVYPITIAFETSSIQSQARETSGVVLGDMRSHYPVLVDEATMVSRELNQVAASISELWLEGLERASRLMVVEGNRKGMLAQLWELHSIPFDSSSRSVAFFHAHGRNLMEAEEWLRVFENSDCEMALLQAWTLYHRVHSQISAQLNGLSALDLAQVAPALLSARRLQLAVPGTYHPREEVVRIESFAPQVKVIGWSKQRPRRITIHSGTGQEHTFLLKGREDLRQDERVMQLFGLLNVLLSDTSSQADLRIQRYAVMPLSNSSGLIGWVPNCDTIYQLIRSYRENREIRVNCEHKALGHAAPNYNSLPLLGKVEAFREACSTTNGQELARILWLSSNSSELWLERRTAFTRSLAVTSMVGYILGLGDRHPSNIMLDRLTGRVVHIDFGDCFEVSMQREQFPETVPFRLTRMLVNAMGASGVEGYFRSTCEVVMEPLRANRDSLTAMLEAFVHDPLISWRLLTALSKNRELEHRVNSGNPNFPTDGTEVDVDDIEYDTVSPEDAIQLQDITLSMLSGTPITHDPGKPCERISNDRGHSMPHGELNAKAVAVLDRIQSKLTGRDFGQEALDVQQQVNVLIAEATNETNLCKLYTGWLPFW